MKNDNLRKYVIRFIFSGVAVLIASATSEGITYGDNTSVLLMAAAILSFLNIILKPLLMLFALPFIFVTLGFGIWIINALLFMLVGFLVPQFEVISFWSALWGAFWVSAMGILANAFIGDPVMRQRINIKVNTPRQKPNSNSLPNKNDSDVIDI